MAAIVSGFFVLRAAKYKTLPNSNNILNKEIMNSLIGPYKGYFHRKKGEIEEFSLEILKNLSIKIDEIDDDYEGLIEFSSNNLICILENKYKRRKAYMIFYVGLSNKLDEIPGVYASLSASGKPVIGNILLRKTNVKVTPRIIKINSSEYFELNANTKNIGRFLIGKTQNYFESIKKNDFSFLSHDEDFGKVFFDLSRYYLFLKDEGKCKKYLDLSYHHGFNDVQLMRKMLGETREGSPIKIQLNTIINSIEFNS